VIDSRTAEDGASTRRRRQCQSCSRRFTTVETVALAVIKRCGTTEPFNRDKVVRGVRRACQGRPVSDGQLTVLAQQVEDQIRSTGAAEVDSQEVGRAVLGPLRQLDEVAYLRFASVYRSFDSIEDFLKEIAVLRGPGQDNHMEQDKQL
jgi:transcriptional repressor NrdR